jgi:hypothetical protein
MRFGELTLRKFGTLVSTTDTTDVGDKLLVASNAMLRPEGAVRGSMLYERLWALGSDQASVTVTFAGDTATKVAHNLVLGAVIRYSTTGTLPTGLALHTDYYVVAIPTANTYKVSATKGGTAITTSGGSGTHSYVATITIEALYRSLTFTGYPNGVGVDSTARSANKTVAVRHVRQGKHFLALYDLVSSQGRGVFYLGDDGTHTGAYSFTTGAAANTVLAVGLNENAMWFGARIAGLLMIQNGEDDPVAVQLGRTKTPGVWRKCGSNAFPATPTVSLAPPANDTNRQADLVFPGATVFTAADFANDYLAVSGKALVDGVNITVSSDTTLPGGLDPATTYYIRDASYNATSNVTIFRVSNTFGGSAINITDAGTGIHTLRNRAGSADLKFTINTAYKGGSSGNSIFRVQITASGYNRDIYSTLTGIGSAGNPFVYTIFVGILAAQNSVDAIATFVANDGKVIPLIGVTKSAEDATTDTTSTLSLALQNGTGNGVSSGFTNKTVTVYLTYFDTGEAGFGYESPSSELTPELYITETARNDVLVTITTNPSAEGGRFDKIRVYLQFEEGAEAIHSLMGEVDNTSGTKTLQIGTNTTIGPALAEFDQNRPLPHKAVVAASSRTWRGALTDAGYRDRLYVSKEASDTEKSPEGVSLEEYEVIDVPDATVPVAIRSLYSDLFRLHVHTNAGIMVIDPADVENTPHRPAVSVGAINPSCFGMGPNNAIIYIGQDVQPYYFDGARYGRRNIKSAAREAEAIIRSVANIDAIGQNSDKVTSFQDKAGMMWWFFPDENNVIKSMCLDLDRNGMMGPFDWPKAVSSCQMEPERPEIVIQDVDGNLFIYDVTQQYDTGADHPIATTFSPTLTTVPPTAGNAGYGYVDYNGYRYQKAVWTTLETGHIDLGQTGRSKCFSGIRFRPIANSRAILIATFRGVHSGQEVTRTFGEIGQFTDKGAKQLMLQLADTAATMKLEILGAEGKPWTIRDVAMLYRNP